MATLGSSSTGSAPRGGGDVTYSGSAPPVNSVPGNDSPYPDEDADFLQLLQWPPTTNFTIGVYTHSAGDHYLIKVASGRISAASLNLTEPGQDLKSGYLQTYPDRSIRSTAVGGSDEQIKYETYILGQAESHGAWVEIGTYSVEGNTLHYGWNFNWDGSSAVCVTQKQNVTIDGKLSSWTARVYYLSIVEDTDNEGDPILVGSVAVDEVSDWEPTSLSPAIMEPNNAGMMVHWMPQSCTAGTVVEGYGEGDFDAPVYAFYKADGSLETIRYSQTALPAQSITDLVDEAREQHCPCLGWQFNVDGEYTSEYEGFLSGRTIGFYSTQGDYRMEEGPGGFWQRRTVKIETTGSGGFNTYLGQTSVEDWTHEGSLPEDACRQGTPIRCRWEHQEGFVNTIDEATSEAHGSNFAVSVTPLLIFPYHTTESVLIGQWEHVSRTSSREDRTAKTGTKMRQVDYYTNLPVSSYYGIYFPVVRDSVSSDCDDLVNDCRRLTRYIWSPGPSGHGWGELPDLSVYETDIISQYNITLSRVSSFGAEQLDYQEYDSYYDVGSYVTWFRPSLCENTISPAKVWDLQSAGGNSFYVESGFDYSIGSNNSIDPAMADPSAFWVGRS